MLFKAPTVYTLMNCEGICAGTKGDNIEKIRKIERITKDIA